MIRKCADGVIIGPTKAALNLPQCSERSEGGFQYVHLTLDLPIDVKDASTMTTRIRTSESLIGSPVENPLVDCSSHVFDAIFPASRIRYVRETSGVSYGIPGRSAKLLTASTPVHSGTHRPDFVVLAHPGAD